MVPSASQACFCALLIVFACFTGAASAQTREESKKPLSAGVEKALTAFTDQCEIEKRKQLTGHMDEALKLVDDTAKLAPEESAALKQVAVKVLETSVTAWRPRFIEALRTYLNRRSEAAAIRHIGEWKPPLAHREPVEDWTAPDEDPAWMEALKATLGDRRFAAWRSANDAVWARRDSEVADYVKRWIDQYRIMMDGTLRLKIENCSTALHLPAERVVALTTAGRALMERLLESERKRGTAMLRPMPDAARDHTIRRSYFYLKFALATGADFNRHWDEILARTLTADELTAWRRHLAEEKAKFDKELPALLKPTQVEMRDQWQKALALQSGYTIAALNLPAQRAKAFEPATKAAMDRAEQRWMERAREQTDGLDHESRQQLLKRGRFYVALDESDLPQNDPAWTSAISQLLSPGELKQLQAAQAERKARRVRALGQILIAEMDQQVAFTASQRERLQPIAERLVKDVPDLFRDHRPNYYFDFRPQVFFLAAKEAAEAELMPVLDAVQRAHWQEAATKAAVEKNRDQEQPKATVGIQPRKPEPEDVEHRISDYLYEKNMTHKRQLLASMLLRAEDATRVAALTDTAQHRLRTAAKGATERAVSAFRSSTEQRVRSLVQGATPENVQQRLNGVQAYYFDGSGAAPPAADRIWTTAVESELTQPQRTAWQKAIDDRKYFREQTITSAVLAEFDRRHMLAPIQCNKLEPLIANIVKEYSPDIDSYFSYSTPWFLQSYSTLIPFAAVPEKELKAILTKEQWDRWTGEDLGNCASYWSNIKEHHDSRVGTKK